MEWPGQKQSDHLYFSATDAVCVATAPKQKKTRNSSQWKAIYIIF